MAIIHQLMYADQYPFVMPNNQALNSIQYVTSSNQHNPLPTQLASTPTSYGYGSWGAVYPATPGIPITGDPNILNSVGK